MSNTDEFVVQSFPTNKYALRGETGGGAWGSITGTLANQTDLQTALNTKSATNHTHQLTAGATDVTASATELNVLDGIPATLTATELGYVDGVTSAIQTQLDAKGTGNVTKVGTPVNNQVGVWTGDGTLEGDAALTYDSTTDTLTSVNFAGNLTGNVTGNVTGSSGSTTGNAATVTTNANLTGHITSTGNAAVLGSFTKAQLDTAVSDGNVQYVGDAPTAHTHVKTDLTDVADFLLESEVDADIKTLSLPASTTISAFGATLVDDIDASTARTTLGLAIGTNVQAYDADLTTWAGVTPGTGVATALGVNIGSAGAPVLFNGALGTPSSGTLTNATGLPLTGLTSDTTTALGLGSINLGHASDTTIARVSAGVASIEGSQIATLNTTSLSGSQTTTLAVKTRYLLSVGLYETQNLTLPATFAVGDEIEVIVSSTSNAGTVNVILAASDNFLYVGDAGSTISTTSNLVQTRNGSFKLVCTVANTTWQLVDICGAAVLFGSTYVSAIGYNVPLSSGDIMFNTAGQTVTNKRNQPRQSSSANGNITPDLSNTNYYIRTGLSGTCTLGVPTGTPVNGEELLFRFKDNGTGRTLTWNAVYVPIGVTLPTTTVANKLTYVRCIYNSTSTNWDVVQVNQEA